MALLLLLANHDERRVDDPDHFDVRREIGQHLMFGFGPHYRLGAALARLEACVVLEEVLSRFPDWEVDEDGIQMVDGEWISAACSGSRRRPLAMSPCRRWVGRAEPT